MPCNCPQTITVTPTSGLDATIDATPTPRRYALHRIATGGTAYVKAGNRYWKLDAATIRSAYAATLAHYTAHQCGQPPPPDTAPTTRRQPPPERPPF